MISSDMILIDFLAAIALILGIPALVTLFAWFIFRDRK